LVSKWEKETKLLIGKFVKKSIQISKLLETFKRSVTARHKLSTARRYKEIIKHLNDYFDPQNLLVEQITRKEIEDYIVHRGSEGLSPATINDELSLFQQIFTYEVDIGVALDNPVRKTPRLKEPKKGKSLEH